MGYNYHLWGLLLLLYFFDKIFTCISALIFMLNLSLVALKFYLFEMFNCYWPGQSVFYVHDFCIFII